MTATVLVVDDLEANVKLLEAKLLAEYYIVLTASGGKQALDVINKNKIDIVLLDVMMPEMDGFEVCRLIKSNPQTMHIPVIMVTALSDIEDRVKGLEAGADEFLTKPVDEIPLFARVKSLARIKSLTDELQIRNQTTIEFGGGAFDINNNDFSENTYLIIDDDVVQAKNINKVLQKLTSKSHTITNINELPTLSFIPDVVLISCDIEGVDPLRICVSLRSKEGFSHIIFMFIAGEEDKDIVMKGLELGVNDYFIYPVDESEILARMKTQLRKKIYQDALKHGLIEQVNLAAKDGLTNIFNRRYFDTHIQKMIQNNTTPLSLIMFDIDHFKDVNDTYGHQAGDDVLKAFANTLVDNVKVIDLVARYGGEEFIILLQAQQKEAIEIGDRIRLAVEATKFKIPDSVIQKTTSVGVAEHKSGESVGEFVKRVDQALYRAKTNGRNKVIASE